MINETVTNKHYLPEAAMEAFLDAPNEESFAALFKSLTPRLVAFFRARGCEAVAEDLAQEVMLTVYRKAAQVRDRALFRAWVFTIARNALSRHWGQRRTISAPSRCSYGTCSASIAASSPAKSLR